MFVDKIRSKQDIEDCVKLYLRQNDETFIQTSELASCRNLFNKIRLNKFVRVAREDSKILAWIYCESIILEHTDYVTFQQMYYGSDAAGVKAVRCIHQLHKAMIEYASTTSAVYCTSAGSPYDDSNVFARTLERAGWSRRGYLAVFRLPHR
jgi:hypothetical protein